MKPKGKEKDKTNEEVEIYSVNLPTAMRMTGYGEWALRRRAANGTIPSSKDKGELLFRVSDLRKHVDDNIRDIRKTA